MNQENQILSPELEARVHQAVENFMQGYGCCQSVVAAFADLYGHDEASGIFKMLANGVVEITRPSSGEKSYYKVKDAQSLIMTDSLGTEPEGAMAKHYVLTKKK